MEYVISPTKRTQRLVRAIGLCFALLFTLPCDVAGQIEPQVHSKASAASAEDYVQASNLSSATMVKLKGMHQAMLPYLKTGSEKAAFDRAVLQDSALAYTLTLQHAAMHPDMLPEHKAESHAYFWHTGERAAHVLDSLFGGQTVSFSITEAGEEHLQDMHLLGVQAEIFTKDARAYYLDLVCYILESNCYLGQVASVRDQRDGESLNIITVARP